jgi:hypothetical protein
MDYSGAEDHEQQGDVGDARGRQVRRRLGGPRLGKQHQREHRRVRGDRDRQRLRPHPDRGEDEQDDRAFRLAYRESPYGYLMTRRIERATAGMPSCVAKQVTRPIRNREARTPEPQLA